MRLVDSVGHDNWAFDLEWSPDGKYLAACMFWHDWGSTTFYLFSFDGTDLEVVETWQPGNAQLAVDWSPDGKYIAISGYFSDPLRIYSFDGNGTTFVTSYRCSSIETLEWSPDGKYIAISGWLSSTEKFAVLSFNGTALTKVDSRQHYRGANEVDWSPDGDRIAVASYYSDVELIIYSFNGTALEEDWSMDKGA
ncbi:MAG: PD40 domain-containing protein, partial [Thermoplasmata archaeon]